ncbi:MAG: hypothetical protein KC493_13785 [Bacteriovoracaceae bacterium]|nr:hypothetical protein [Bacteriovoracaceae bacterium]
MLDKNYDLTMVGKSYLSMLFSMEFIDWGQNTLVIDDKRLQFGPLYSGILNQIDVNFLETWGEDRGIEPLAQIQKYLRPVSLSFYIDKQWLKLGGSPEQNLLELHRKFPKLFGVVDSTEGETGDDSEKEIQTFNDCYFNFARRMSQNCFRFRTLQNLNIQTFLNLCPREILDQFKVFKSQLDHNKKLDLIPLHQKTFFYLSRGFIQKKLSMRGNDLELFHLMMSLLSPCYKLDEEALMIDLEPVFKGKGGVCKETTIREWLFDKRKPWSLELSSFEGIIHPDRIALMGGRPEKMPISIDVKGKCFRNIEVDIEMQGDLDSFFKDDYFVFTESSRIGGQYPFWTLKREGDNKFRVSLYTLAKKGMKISFLQKKSLEILNQDLNTIIGKPLELEVTRIVFGKEVCLEDNKGDERLNSILDRVNIMDSSSPGDGNKLKKVHYFGPLKKGSLGLFSTLMEIKEGIRVV